MGDVALGGEFLAEARPHGASLTYPFKAVNGPIRECDGLVLNLEGPIGKDGTPRPGVTARMYNDEAVLDWFVEIGTCVCNLANNHTMDYGPEALDRTLELLGKARIPFVGAGKEPAAAARPAFVPIKGRVIGFLNYTTNERHVGSVLATEGSPGCAGLPDESRLMEVVKDAASRCDSLVVSLHWGHEFHWYPIPEHVSLARKLIEQGACVVAAHHPHVQQAVEEHQGGLIAYSLGNFLMPEFRYPRGRLLYRKPYTRQFTLLRAELEGRRAGRWDLIGGRWDRHYRLNPYTGSRATRFQGEMKKLATPLRGDDYPSFWRRYVARRSKELRRERYRDILGKLWLADWSELASSLTAKFGFKRAV